MNGCIFWNNIQKFVGFYFKGRCFIWWCYYYWNSSPLDYISPGEPLLIMSSSEKRSWPSAEKLSCCSVTKATGLLLFLRCPLVIHTHWASHVLLPSVGRYKDRYCRKISDEVGTPFKRMIMFNFWEFTNPSIKTSVMEFCCVQGDVLGAAQILREIDAWPLASKSLWSGWEDKTWVCENNFLKKRKRNGSLIQQSKSCPTAVYSHWMNGTGAKC